MNPSEANRLSAAPLFLGRALRVLSAQSLSNFTLRYLDSLSSD